MNTFHPVDSFFLISKLIILINFSLYILWIRIYEFSPLQCLVLFLISSQERTNINCIKKQTSKNIFYSKSKLNQAFVLALPDWQLLCQVSNSTSNYILIFGKLFHSYKLIYIDLKPGILIGLVFLRQKKGPVVCWCSSLQSYCLKWNFK